VLHSITLLAQFQTIPATRYASNSQPEQQKPPIPLIAEDSLEICSGSKSRFCDLAADKMTNKEARPFETEYSTILCKKT